MTARSHAEKYASMPQRALPGATLASTAGSKVSTWMPTESMPMSATRSMTSRSAGGSNCTCTGRPAAALTDSPQRPTYIAPRSGVAVLPVVSVASTAPSRSLAARATSASIAGVFFAMVRPAASVTPMPQKVHWSSLPQ